MHEMRMGVVGLGSRGVWWIKSIRQIEGYRITAICDPIAAFHQRALLELPNPNNVAAYTSYQDVLADPNVDAIGLCVRCLEQGSLAARALEVGKHVNSEVPAAHTIDDCWCIVNAAERFV